MAQLSIYHCLVFRSRQKAEQQQQQKKPPDDAVRLKPMKGNEDGGEGVPLTDGEDQTFRVEIPDKYDGEEKEPLKANIAGSGETAPAGEAGNEAETTAAVRRKTYEPSLWLAICRTYFKPFVVGAFFKLGHDTLMFISPLLLKYVFGTIAIVYRHIISMYSVSQKKSPP